jgi:predicted phage tail protein
MMRTIHLHGSLGEKFGASHRFNVATAGEAFRALYTAFGAEFLEEIRSGAFQVVQDNRGGGRELDIDLICKFRLGSADLHIVPVAIGASSKGTGTVKAVAGLAIVGAAIFMSGGTLAAPLAGMSGAVIPGFGAISWGSVAAVGLGLTLAGAASMLASNQSTQNEADNKSFLFNGPVNVNEQGNAVPLIFGEVICGSQAISAGFDIEDTTLSQQQLGSLAAQQGFV